MTMTMNNIVPLPPREERESRGFGLQTFVDFLLTTAINQWRTIDECTRSMGRVCDTNRKKTRKLLHRAKAVLLERYKLALLYEYVPRDGAKRGHGKICSVQVFDPANASPAAQYAADQLMQKMVKRTDATLDQLAWLRQAMRLLPKNEPAA